MAIGSRIGAKAQAVSEEMSRAMQGYPGIYHLLAGEHAEVASLMEKVGDADTEEREKLLAAINKSLVAHSRAEEECFYPELNQHEELRDKVGRCLAEHEKIEELLGHLNNSDAGTQHWMEAFAEFKRLVELHVAFEEREVFPQALHRLGRDKAGEMKQNFEEEEKRVKSRLS